MKINSIHCQERYLVNGSNNLVLFLRKNRKLKMENLIIFESAFDLKTFEISQMTSSLAMPATALLWPVFG